MSMSEFWRIQYIIRWSIDPCSNLSAIWRTSALVKQAQEMSGRMQALQEQLKTKRATGAAGGGLVEVEVNGLGEALVVRIDPSLVEKGEREMIEDLLPAAINAAQAKAKQLHAEAMQSIAGEMSIPGLSDALSTTGRRRPPRRQVVAATRHRV